MIFFWFDYDKGVGLLFEMLPFYTFKWRDLQDFITFCYIDAFLSLEHS